MLKCVNGYSNIRDYWYLLWELWIVLAPNFRNIRFFYSIRNTNNPHKTFSWIESGAKSLTFWSSLIILLHRQEIAFYFTDHNWLYQLLLNNFSILVHMSIGDQITNQIESSFDLLLHHAKVLFSPFSADWWPILLAIPMQMATLLNIKSEDDFRVQWIFPPEMKLIGKWRFDRNLTGQKRILSDFFLWDWLKPFYSFFLIWRANEHHYVRMASENALHIFMHVYI